MAAHKQNLYYIGNNRGEMLANKLDEDMDGPGSACYEFDWVLPCELGGRQVIVNEQEGDISETIDLFFSNSERAELEITIKVAKAVIEF